MSRRPLSEPRLICSGWWADREKTRRVHDDVRVLREGPTDEPASHGVCRECRLAFIANIPRKEETPA